MEETVRAIASSLPTQNHEVVNSQEMQQAFHCNSAAAMTSQASRIAGQHPRAPVRPRLPW
eukprot:2172578-Prorocentrum_lima.AAC.1